jgi:citrate lyase subunit beta/citryl-CoA lyase
MRLRSLLFVPGDRPERFAKAAASGADAVILDLEDSVGLSAKATARAAVADYLTQQRSLPVLVRINPLATAMAADDLAAVLSARPDGIVLPKAEGSASVAALIEAMGEGAVPVLPIATETPAAVFQLGTYGAVAKHLLGLTWGAEDLPAAIGAATSREEDGRYTPPYEMLRGLTLFAAHAAETAAIETVFPAIRDEAGLAAYVARARRMALPACWRCILRRSLSSMPDLRPPAKKSTRHSASSMPLPRSPMRGCCRWMGGWSIARISCRRQSC